MSASTDLTTLNMTELAGVVVSFPNQSKGQTTNTDAPFRFTDLPFELQTQIVDLLNLPDFCRVKATSKHMRSLIPNAKWTQEILRADAVIGFARERQHGYSEILDFDKDSVRHIANSLLCPDCRDIRPLSEFGMVLSGSSSALVEDHISGLRKWVSEWILPHNQPVAQPGLDDRCFDCIIAHPSYLGTSMPPIRRDPNLDLIRLQHPGLEEKATIERGRWIELANAVTLVCAGCNELKTYSGDGGDIPNETRENTYMPCARQVLDDLCRECWKKKYGKWLGARAVLSSRLAELNAEVDALQDYEDWMESVDTQDPDGNLWGPPFPAKFRGRWIGTEPERKHLVKDFPQWSEEELFGNDGPVYTQTRSWVDRP